MSTAEGMPKFTRRSAVLGVALAAALVAAPVIANSGRAAGAVLADRIKAHSAAAALLNDACERHFQAEDDMAARPYPQEIAAHNEAQMAASLADDVEVAAAAELMAYRPRNAEEAATKAAYLEESRLIEEIHLYPSYAEGLIAVLGQVQS